MLSKGSDMDLARRWDWMLSLAWFQAFAKEYMAPVLEPFGFTRVQMVGFPGDDNWGWHGDILFWNAEQRYVSVDMMDRTFIGDDYCLVRCYAPFPRFTDLRSFLYPQIRSQTNDVELWQGWKCQTRDDVRDALIEIAAGLKTLFTQYSPDE
jgi:hypothetical protein